MVDQNILLAGISMILGAVLAYLLFGSKSSSTKPTPKAKPEPRAYTREEVAKHNTEGDFWLIIKTKGSDKYKVFDLSGYADEHPGGDIIYRNAGKDATEGFFGPQHPPTVHDLIPEYYIGWIEE